MQLVYGQVSLMGKPAGVLGLWLAVVVARLSLPHKSPNCIQVQHRLLPTGDHFLAPNKWLQAGHKPHLTLT